MSLASRSKKVIPTALEWETDLAIKSTKGCYIEDYDGNRFLDFTSGVAVANIGYNHPEVIKAAKEQMDLMLHHGTMFVTEPVIKMCEELQKITPDSISRFFPLNSGSESVEAAIKLARFSTKRQGIIAFKGAFHGRTFGAMTLTTSKSKYSTPYAPLVPGVYHAPYPYPYRDGSSVPEESAQMALDGLRDVLKKQISPDGVAAIIAEPIQGEGGYIVPPREFLQGLRALCDEHNILLILDEVQSGMGRTCKWFAAEHFGIEPDIITIAKGIAGGFPLSAVGAREDLMVAWEANMHGTTFGGNPVSCAASVATIEAIRKHKLLDKGEKLSEILLKRLRELKSTYAVIGDVRGLGLMVGVEFIDEAERELKTPNPTVTKEIRDECLQHGLLLLTCGTNGNVIRLIPPLITSAEDLKKGLDIFEDALKSRGA